MGMAIFPFDKLKEGENPTDTIDLRPRPEKPHEEVSGFVVCRYKYIDEEKQAMRAADLKAAEEAEAARQAKIAADWTVWKAKVKKDTMELKGLTEEEYDSTFNSTSRRMLHGVAPALAETGKDQISREDFHTALMSTKCPEMCVRSYYMGLELRIPWNEISERDQVQVVGIERSSIVNSFISKLCPDQRKGSVYWADAMACLAIFASAAPQREDWKLQVARAAFEILSNSLIGGAGQIVFAGEALDRVLTLIVRAHLHVHRVVSVESGGSKDNFQIAMRKYVYDKMNKATLVPTFREEARCWLVGLRFL